MTPQGPGSPRVVQAAPGGYLVDLGDGSEPRLFPESTLVAAGLVGPTQGSELPQAPAAAPQAPIAPPVQQPLPGAAPLPYSAPEPAPVAPSPAAPASPGAPPVSLPTPLTGTSQRQSAGASFGTTQLVRRTDGPAPLDLSAERAALGSLQDESSAARLEQQHQLGVRAGTLQQADEVRYGKYGPDGQLLESGGAQQQIAERDRLGEAQQAFNAVTQEYVQRKTGELNEAIARIPQEDPGRIWSDNSAFQNAAGLMAAALGGMLAVSTGSGRNMGLEAIERAIDRDVQAQRTNIENAWRKVQHDENSLNQYRQWRSQEKQDMLAQGIFRLETLALETEAKASTFSSAARQAEYLGAAAELRAVSAEKQAEYVKATGEYSAAEAASRLATYRASLDRIQTMASASASYAQAAHTRAETEALKNKPPPQPLVLSDRTGMTVDPASAAQFRVVGKDGKTISLYTPRSPEEKKQLDDIGATALKQQTTLAAIREFLRTNPSSWSPGDRLRFNGLVTDYVMSGGEKLGRMTDKDIELLKTRSGGDPLKFTNGLLSLGASIEAVEDTMESNRAKYEIDAQQINRDIRVRLPEPDPVLLQRFGPQDAVYQDDVGNAAAQAKRGLSDTTNRAPIRRQESIQGLVDAVVARGVDASAADAADVQGLIAEVEKLPPEQRVVKQVVGGNTVSVDALTVLRSALGQIQFAEGPGGQFVRRFSNEGTVGGEYNILTGEPVGSAPRPEVPASTLYPWKTR